MKRWALPVVVAALAVAPPAHAAALSCGDTVTTDVVLHADLTGCPGDGLVVGADGVTVDLAGHTIGGDGAAADDAPDSGVRSDGHDHVTVVGGRIEGFTFGTWISGGTAARVLDLRIEVGGAGVLVEDADRPVVATTQAAGGFVGIVVAGGTAARVAHDITTDNEAIGIGTFDSTRPTLQGNRVLRSDDNGIVAVEADRLRAIGNVVRDTAFGAIALDGGADGLVLRNRLDGNGDGVVVGGDRNRITENVVRDAVGCEDEGELGCGYGISIEAGSGNVVDHNHVLRTARAGMRLDAYGPPVEGTVFRANDVRAAGTDGIAIGTDELPDEATGTLLERNHVIGAGDDGYDVRDPGTVLRANLALRNGALGFRVTEGTTDGGGNRAALNGDPLQCVGIAC